MQLPLQEPPQPQVLVELVRSRQLVQLEEYQIGRLAAEVIKLRKEAEVARLDVTSGFDVSLNLQVKFKVSGFGACSGCPSYKYRSGR